MKRSCHICHKMFTCNEGCDTNNVTCYCDPCVKGKLAYLQDCGTKFVEEKPRKGKLIGGHPIQ